MHVSDEGMWEHADQINECLYLQVSFLNQSPRTSDVIAVSERVVVRVFTSEVLSHSPNSHCIDSLTSLASPGLAEDGL